MIKHGKVWGTTARIFGGSTVEVHRIEVQPGGYCSKHRHRAKSNQFFVECGKLQVLEWRDNGTVDSTDLGEGESMTVSPGVPHQFRTDVHCTAYEIYEVILDPEDIERETVGGRDA